MNESSRSSAQEFISQVLEIKLTEKVLEPNKIEEITSKLAKMDILQFLKNYTKKIDTLLSNSDYVGLISFIYKKADISDLEFKPTSKKQITVKIGSSQVLEFTGDGSKSSNTMKKAAAIKLLQYLPNNAMDEVINRIRLDDPNLSAKTPVSQFTMTSNRSTLNTNSFCEKSKVSLGEESSGFNSFRSSQEIYRNNPFLNNDDFETKSATQGEKDRLSRPGTFSKKNAPESYKKAIDMVLPANKDNQRRIEENPRPRPRTCSTNIIQRSKSVNTNANTPPEVPEDPIQPAVVPSSLSFLFLKMVLVKKDILNWQELGFNPVYPLACSKKFPDIDFCWSDNTFGSSVKEVLSKEDLIFNTKITTSRGCQNKMNVCYMLLDASEERSAYRGRLCLSSSSYSVAQVQTLLVLFVLSRHVPYLYLKIARNSLAKNLIGKQENSCNTTTPKHSEVSSSSRFFSQSIKQSVVGIASVSEQVESISDIMARSTKPELKKLPDKQLRTNYNNTKAKGSYSEPKLSTIFKRDVVQQMNFNITSAVIFETIKVARDTKTEMIRTAGFKPEELNRILEKKSAGTVTNRLVQYFSERIFGYRMYMHPVDPPRYVLFNDKGEPMLRIKIEVKNHIPSESELETTLLLMYFRIVYKEKYDWLFDIWAN